MSLIKEYPVNSWYGKIYFRYYKRTGKQEPENVDSCHVRKIVLLYAPLYGFFHARTRKIKISPAVIFGFVLICALIGLYPAIAMRLWDTTVEIAKEVLAPVLFIAIFVAFWVGIGRIAYYIHTKRDALKKFILFQWMADVKDKVCRPIEWTN